MLGSINIPDMAKRSEIVFPTQIGLPKEVRDGIFESVFKPQPREARPTLSVKPARSSATSLELIGRQSSVHTRESILKEDKIMNYMTKAEVDKFLREKGYGHIVDRVVKTSNSQD